MLRTFEQTGVEYLVIGGYAVSEHTEPRYTKDLDIWINNTEENAIRVVKALREFGAPLMDITSDDFTNPSTVYQIGLPPSRIDILSGLKEMDFADCWHRRNVVEMGDLFINYISIPDLIVNKELAGRPQDLIDARHLRKKKQMFEK